MITYDAGYWGLACIWQVKGSVFPKALVWSLPCTAVAAILHHVMHTDWKDWAEEFGLGDAAATVFNGFNFVLGFLIVFRSQQAYSRWWEGGTLLQQLRGEWFNSFSCLVAFCNSAPEKQKDVERFQQQLVRLFSLLYGCAITQVSCMSKNNFELINLDGFDGDSLRFLQTTHDKCEIALQWIQRMIVEAEQKQILKIAPPILSRVYNELGNGIVNLNNARKIKEFPIPFPLAQMIMVMLLFHAVFTPLICAATVKTTMWASLITFVVSFCYWSVLYIALELEMPYGDDPNDLPLKDMAMDMNKSLVEMLDKRANSVPGFNLINTDLKAWTLDLDSDLSVAACTDPSSFPAAKLEQIEISAPPLSGLAPSSVPAPVPSPKAPDLSPPRGQDSKVQPEKVAAVPRTEAGQSNPPTQNPPSQPASQPSSTAPPSQVENDRGPQNPDRGGQNPDRGTQNPGTDPKVSGQSGANNPGGGASSTQQYKDEHPNVPGSPK